MPSGRVHAATTIALTLGLGAACYSAGWPSDQQAALAGGSLAGLLLSPDLDVQQGSISFKFARRSFGCLFGLLWEMYWKPYAVLIPHHRHWLSHMPFISTAIRLLYLAMPLLLWRYWQYHQIGLVLPTWFILAYYGLASADLLHWFLDTITKRRKRR